MVPKLQRDEKRIDVQNTLKYIAQKTNMGTCWLSVRGSLCGKSQKVPSVSKLSALSSIEHARRHWTFLVWEYSWSFYNLKVDVTSLYENWESSIVEIKFEIRLDISMWLVPTRTYFNWRLNITDCAHVSPLWWSPPGVSQMFSANRSDRCADKLLFSLSRWKLHGCGIVFSLLVPL